MTQADAADVDTLGLRMKAAAEEGLANRDWHRAYEAAKSWIFGGGGAYFVDPWLVYAASALLHRQPRIATHSLDVGLASWVENPVDRAILHTVRGWIVLETFRDPAVALVDFDECANSVPKWLAAAHSAGRDRARAEAPKSRKRKPSVPPAPTTIKPSTAPVRVGSKVPTPGAVPGVWQAVIPHLPGMAGHDAGGR